NIFFILIFSLLTLLSLLSFNLTFSLIYEKINTIGTTDKVLVNFTIIAKLPATSENAYPAATTEEVSFTAVPVHNPNTKSLIPKYFPAIGKSTIITISNINVADIEYAISLGSASIVGAIAPIADAPHIPVPADIKLDNFQFIPNNFPR